LVGVFTTFEWIFQDLGRGKFVESTEVDQTFWEESESVLPAGGSGVQSAVAFHSFVQNGLSGFQSNELGYQEFQLPADDLLFKAIAQMPKPSSFPKSYSSFILLDRGIVNVSSNRTAKSRERLSTFVIDPERGGAPDVGILYNSSQETLRLKAVRIVDAKGRGRNLDVSRALDRHVYSTQSVYWDVRRISLELPPLKADQILDVLYERETRPIMDQFYNAWITGGKPVILGDYSLSFPESLQMQKQEVRTKARFSETKDSQGIVTWHLQYEDVDMAESEPFTNQDYEAWQGYVFSTPVSWVDIGKWFENLCKDRNRLPPDAKARVAELKTKYPNSKVLLQALFDWVTRDIRYVSIRLGISSYPPHSVSDTLQHLYGDCKDQSLLLHSLCQEAGIASSMILVGSGFGRKFDTPFPSVRHFDHCILEAQIQKETYYLDATAGPYPMGWIPVSCSSTQALRIQKEQPSVIDLPPYKPLSVQGDGSKTLIQIDPDASATVTRSNDLSGWQARFAKNSARNMSTEKFRKQLEESFRSSNQKLLDYQITGPQDPGEEYHFKIQYRTPKFATRSSEGLIFKLALHSEEGEEPEPDWSETRTQPFRFYPSDPRIEQVEIELPKNYVLRTKPEDLEIETAFIKFSRKVSLQGERIQMTEYSQILDARLPADQFQIVKSTFKKIHDLRELALICSLTQTPLAPKDPPVANSILPPSSPHPQAAK
jgi:hypothetical protein